MPDETMDFEFDDAQRDAERDPRWRRVVAELRRAPFVRDAALDAVMAEVLAATPATRARPTTPRASARPRGRLRDWLLRPRTVALTPLHAAAALLLVAVAFGAALSRGADRTTRLAASPASPPSPASAPTPGGQRGATRTVQFVFVSGAAREVSIVGDFNDWQSGTTPLRRVSPDGLWTVEVPLEPGRYTYAFVVDGTRWVPDEGAPRAPDDEFGGETSVVYVRQDI